jgi:hypothetical protein
MFEFTQMYIEDQFVESAFDHVNQGKLNTNIN